MTVLHWLHDIPGTNRYVFRLYHLSSLDPIREEVVRTRSCPTNPHHATETHG